MRQTGSGRDQSPDSHAAFGLGHPFSLSPRPCYILKHHLLLPLCPCTLPSPSQSLLPCQAPFPPIFQNFLLFLNHLIISGFLQSF